VTSIIQIGGGGGRSKRRSLNRTVGRRAFISDLQQTHNIHIRLGLIEKVSQNATLQ